MNNKLFYTIIGVTTLVLLAFASFAVQVNPAKGYHLLQQIARSASNMNSIDSNGDGIIDADVLPPTAADCIDVRSSSTTATGFVQYCPSDHPKMISCNTISPDAGSSPELLTGCPSSMDCAPKKKASDSTNPGLVRASLTSKDEYYETVMNSNAEGCWMYRTDKKAIKMELSCCK